MVPGLARAMERITIFAFHEKFLVLQLAQGIIIQVSPSLVKRRKTHFHALPCGASIILGNNGSIWISATMNEDTEQTGGYEQDLEVWSLTNWRL